MANYNTKYKPEFCDLLVEHLKKGYSFYSFGGDVGASKQTLFTWVEKHPEFSEAKKIGEQLALKYFDKRSRASILNCRIML
jgi:hypothetical protein